MYYAVENLQLKFSGTPGRIAYAPDFLRLDLVVSNFPFSIMLLLSPVLPSDHTILCNLAKFCLTLRLFRFEKYSQAFTTFDDVIRDNLDVLGYLASAPHTLGFILFHRVLG